MNVFPKLSKNAWITLLTIIDQPRTATQTAKENNMQLSHVSEAMTELEKAGILKNRERKSPLSVEAQLKATLRDLQVHYSRKRLMENLEGNKLNVLFQVLEGYDTIQKLNLITSYSVSTLKRALSHFQGGLFIYQSKKGVYEVRNEYLPLIRQLYLSFFAYFLDKLKKQNMDWKEINVFGENILLKSEQDISGFTYTGFNLFHKYQVQLFLTKDNYLVNYEKEPKREEVFIHALAISTDFRDHMYCLLFADLNKLTKKDLGKLPIIYRVEKKVTAIFDYLKTNGRKTADYLPTYKEYMEVRRDYARS